MQNSSTIKVLLAILIVAVIGGVYLFMQNKKSAEVTTATNNQAQGSNTVIAPAIHTTSSEESSTEVFQKQPGEVTAINPQINGYSLSVDLLSPNPNFKPGETSFFINQNPKIRTLKVATEGKFYICGLGTDNNETTADVPESYADSMKKMKVGRTAYFDISGSIITAMYEQCLP